MRLPAGVRDWLPRELESKRSVEATLRSAFERAGYAEVQTPGFELAGVLEAGLGDRLMDQTFQFSDQRGARLSLRPDMTTPIARLVASRMRDAALPIRLSYVQPVYRYEEPQEGRMREFTQAGIELIGDPGVGADAEALFAAFAALDALGLGDAHVDINHAAIVDGVLAGIGFDAEQTRRCKQDISDRNLVSLRAFVEESGRTDAFDTLRALTLSRGTTDVLDFARRLCRTDAGKLGIERLATILAEAQRRGFAERVSVDLSLLRDFAYYTGFGFEGFVTEVGFALVGGGRYDALLGRFGYDVCAVGWSLSVEALLIALERRERSAPASAPGARA